MARGDGDESAPQTLHCVRQGAGRPVVLLHGAFVTHTDWPSAITGPVAKFGEVIQVDRPGHGGSPRLRYAGDANAQARQIEGALALNQPAILVAHSFGSLTALKFAEQFPEQVAGIVLLAPICFPEWRAEHVLLGPRAFPFMGPPLSALAHASIDPLYLRWIQDQMFAPQPVPQDWRAAYPIDDILTPAHFVREAEDSLAASPLSFGAYRTAMPPHPLTILQGDADRIMLNGWHAQIVRWLAPETRLVWLRGVGHMLHHVEPQRVVHEIARLADQAA